jgi:DNA excision repair protein ERCC-2
MPVVVDLEKRTIVGPIRDLTESIREGPRGLGLLSRVRSELGMRVHQNYRQVRKDREGFLSEVAVNLHTEIDGFQVALRGRIDGLIRTADTVVLEEVKSVSVGGVELARVRAESFPEYSLQLRLYALAYALDHPEQTIRARLILVSLIDDGRRDIMVPLNPADTRAQLVDLLRQWIKEAEGRYERAARFFELATQLKFPYPAVRPHQAELMTAMSEGLAADRPVLAMAPTGIGKTVSALLTGLRHALQKNTQLIYVTAKTTQQHLVERTFEDICVSSEIPSGALRCLTLRNKESMCPAGALLCHAEVCEFLEDFPARVERSQAIEKLLQLGMRIDPDAIRMLGEAHRLCPFALSLMLIPDVQLVICDYNYVYDPSVALAQFFDENNLKPVVVIDEAHNLFDRARGYYSPFLEGRELDELDQRIAAGEFLAAADQKDQLSFNRLLTSQSGPALFERLRMFITQLKESIARTLTAAAALEGGLDNCRPVEPERDRFHEHAEHATELLLAYALYNRTHALAYPQDPVLDLLSRVIHLRDVLSQAGYEIVPYAAFTGAPPGEGFGCLCVNPAKQLLTRHRQAAGTIAISATLTPLSYYADVLGFTALNPVTVSLASPFPRENLGVWVVPSVSTAYRARARHRDAIARIIEQTYGARAGRYVAFFPSYQFLADVHKALTIPSEQLLVQQQGLAGPLRKQLLTAFRESSGPMLLLAVMGGVFAEGIDLPGSELIGAVIIGPGFPQVGFERAVMQDYFEREYERGFAYAMVYPGMQRVIQSAGRVIRTPEDTGVIVLADRRFAEAELAACLPPHWYRYDPSELITDDLQNSLTNFWSSHAMSSL